MNEYEKLVSGITQLYTRDLSGKGVIIAVLDSGIDYRNHEFRKSDGSTRIIGILNLEDENTFYEEDQINEALKENRSLVTDLSGHGTAVASVACGNTGVAYEADLLLIKLANKNRQMLTTSLMKGVAFAVRFASQRKQPLVINISIGSNYGSHQGSSLLARFMDNAAEIGKTAIVVGSGNEGTSGGHVSGIVRTKQSVELSVSSYETGLTIQLFKFLQDEIKITLQSPDGESWILPKAELTQVRISQEQNRQTKIYFFVGVPLPYQQQQEILIELLPVEGASFITPGIWKIEFEAEKIVTGQFQIYLTGSGARNTGTGFLSSSQEGTLTIPSTASRVITVGAYDVVYNRYADFSGRGFVTTYEANQGGSQQLITPDTKPDLVAPGVNVSVAKVGGGYEKVSGTSFAAPFVAGSAALLMEWGIIKGNDIYMYGEKMKAYFQANAKAIFEQERYPDERVGWGALFLSLL